jgi:hypothetical protein
MRHTSNLTANTDVCRETLGALELATGQASDTDLRSKLDVCRFLYAQVIKDD